MVQNWPPSKVTAFMTKCSPAARGSVEDIQRIKKLISESSKGPVFYRDFLQEALMIAENCHSLLQKAH